VPATGKISQRSGFFPIKMSVFSYGHIFQKELFKIVKIKSAGGYIFFALILGGSSIMKNHSFNCLPF